MSGSITLSADAERHDPGRGVQPVREGGPVLGDG
jgi:hypothetical protein